MPVIYEAGPLWVNSDGYTAGEIVDELLSRFATDSARAASVDDLIDNIDAVLESHRSDS